MKKTLIALTAAASIAAGLAATVSTAEAKVHLNVNVGLPGLFVDPGYGYYDTGYYAPDCGYVTVKKVKWIDGVKYVSWKKKLVCE